jgi:hypothetical protein
MIPNGRALGMGPEEFDPSALSKGQKVEMEHTSDPDVAEHIAMDHLSEDPRYYDKLEKLESGGMLWPTGYKGTLLAAGGYGVAGWVLENTIFGPRYSNLFGRVAVPFLPVYAIGGTAVAALAPRLKESALPWYFRAAAYAALLSGVEWLGCRIDRDVLHGCAWDYTGQKCAEPAKGCIDLPHFLLWGILGLVVEKVGE